VAITSLHNPHVKRVVRLRQRRHREAEGVMLIEGADELGLALAGGVRPQTVYVCPALTREPGPLRARLPAEAEVVEVAAPAFEKMAYREHPDGWLAVAPAPLRRLEDLAPGPMPLLLVCESVEKPGNLGAMLRTTDAAGADALVVCDPRTDLGNPNVVRASRGALFTVPVAQAESAAALDWLRSRGLTIVAATPQAETLYTRADLRGPVAVVVGAEDAGLSDLWLARADQAVRIPMTGKVNSLNVAASAALLLYEAVRQRTT
jgi:TrmH family RNA methyltransferase